MITRYGMGETLGRATLAALAKRLIETEVVDRETPAALIAETALMTPGSIELSDTAVMVFRPARAATA